MDMLPIVKQMGMLFLTMFLGFIGGKTGCLTETSNKVLSSVVINLTLPCSVLYSALCSERVLSNAQVGLLTVEAIIAFAIVTVFAKLLMKLFGIPERERGVCEFMAIFSNGAFMGYPVIRSLFGTDALFLAAMVNMVSSVYSYSYGVYIVKGSGDEKFRWKELTTPMVIASVLACVLYMLKVRLPQFIMDWMGFVDQATSPLSMMTVGCALAFANRERIRSSWKTDCVVLIRMLVFPLVCYWIITAVTGNELIAGVMAVLFAMPAAASTTMFCARYDNDQGLASAAIFITTVASGVTIPLVCFLMTSLN